MALPHRVGQPLLDRVGGLHIACLFACLAAGWRRVFIPRGEQERTGGEKGRKKGEGGEGRASRGEGGGREKGGRAGENEDGAGRKGEWGEEMSCAQ